VVDSVHPIPLLIVPAWQQLPGLEHGFCTRRGGMSTGAWAELNLSSKVGDVASVVADNWGRVRSHVGGRLEFVTMDQVHGARVFEVAAAGAEPGGADALISAVAGQGLCVLTADCVPILLLSPQARAVAAIHAGWRGTVAGIVVAALAAMARRWHVRPNQVWAALGPAVGPCCYEVDGRIIDDLESRWGSMPGAIRRYERDGVSKAKLDLRAANSKLLENAGVDVHEIRQAGGCTSCESSEFFSHRQATRSDPAGVTGRQLSFIGWAG